MVPFLSFITGIILAVAIGFAVAILVMILIILYCCERYRHNKKFRKLLKKLGGLTAEGDPLDEVDFARKDGWDDGAFSTYNLYIHTIHSIPV